MKNIGCVIYTKTNKGLKAKWAFSKKDAITQGTGIAVRLTQQNPQNTFEGTYEIVYSDLNGTKSPKMELIISFTSGHYQLKWVNNGIVADIGIGIELDNKLSAGWHEIN